MKTLQILKLTFITLILTSITNQGLSPYADIGSKGPHLASSGISLLDDPLEGATLGNYTGDSYYAGYKGGKGIFLQNSETLTYSGGYINPDPGTVEFWIKPNWDGDDNTKHELFDYSNGEISIVKTTENRLRFTYNGVVITSTVLDQWVTDEWHNLALTWNTQLPSKFLTAYVDGKRFETTSEQAQSVSANGQITIGSKNGIDPHGTTFDGIKIHDYKKSFDQLEIYQSNTLGSPVWYFAEGATGDALFKDYNLDQKYPGYFPASHGMRDCRKEFLVFNPNHEVAEIKLTFYGVTGEIFPESR